MIASKYRSAHILSGILVIILLTSCASPTDIVASSTASPIKPSTPVPSSTPSATPLPTAQPTPTPHMLTICMGAEPETLYIYGGSMLAQANILAAIYDGPIDDTGYGYQPIILEKLPSLADGDASLLPVEVKAGDLIVNDAGEVVTLKVGEVVRPYGCNLSSCAITWDGSQLTMGQLSSTFSLLEGLKWSDGEPLTAQDSVFSFRIASDPDSLTDKYTIQRTASYTALDERTIQWVGRPGFLDPAYQRNFYHPLPEHQLSTYSAEELSEAKEANYNPLGWGPYMITKYQPGEYIKMAPNPYYHRASEGLPYFDQLTFRFVMQDSASNLAAIAKGTCDIFDQEASVKTWDEELQKLIDEDAAGNINLYISPGTIWEHIDLNIRPLEGAGFAGLDMDGDGIGPFGDVRLRQAIALCIDRQAVVDAIYLGQTIILNTYLPPEHPLYNPDVSIWPYDPSAGAMLLDEIGWLDSDGDPTTPRQALNVIGVPDGTYLEFNLETTTSTQRQQVTQLLAENMAQCGIKANLAYYPAAEWFADAPEGKLFGRRFDLGQFAWLTGVNPACELYMSDQIPGPEDQINPATGKNYLGWKVQNDTGYSNPAFDAACQAARQALPGMPEYAQNHAVAEEIFANDLPAIPLYLRIRWTVTRPDLCGHWMDATSRSDFWNIEAYNYGDGCP